MSFFNDNNAFVYNFFGVYIGVPMATDTPTMPLSIRVAVDIAQKFQMLVAQRGMKAGSLLESLIPV